MNLLAMLPKNTPIWPLVEQTLVSNGCEDRTVLSVLKRLIEGGKPTSVAVLSAVEGAETIEVRRENANETVILTVHCLTNPENAVDNRNAA